MPLAVDHREGPRLGRGGVFFWRLMAALAALALALAAVLAATFSGASRSLLEAQLDARLADAAKTTLEFLSDRWPAQPEAAVQAQIRRLGERLGARVTLIDPTGRVLADSYETTLEAVSRMENHRDRTEFIEAVRGGTGSATRLSPSVGTRFRYQAVAVETPAGARLGVVRTAYPLTVIASQAAVLERWTWAVSAIIAVLAVGLGGWVLSQLTAPVRTVAAAADSLLQGKLDGRPPLVLPALGDDELGLALRALIDARKRLAANEQRLQSTSQTQATVLDGMAESVIAVDRHERVLFANAAAGAALGFDARASQGATLLEAVRSHELREAVQNALRSRQACHRELDWRTGVRRTFDVLAAPLPGEPAPGVVLVLRDVTEFKRLQEMREQFVANVSHELKTPLASIKAYTETLLGGARHDPVHCERFLGRIDEQAARLHTLIQDMLSLARIEAGHGAAQLTAVSVARAAHRALADHEPQAVAGDIVLVNHATDESLKVQADDEGLAQVLNNLVDNAVKYTPPGGRVAIAARREGAWAVIDVTDTGVGIAAEHHSRLFERFYRVDRARSRELGGTGLGLSIVKHLAQSMGGGVSVASAPGRGSTFTVRLPLAPQGG